MTIERIENSSLWKSTLANQENDEDTAKREELRSALLKLRENVSHLVTKISATLPELTQHEISHLDALWETASLIAGSEYSITPLEGFILGGSMLLHDSALCFEAFKGKDFVRSTVQWKDSYASISDSENPQVESLKHQADFMALRLLHAEQAENLLNEKWIDPDNDQEIYLLENQGLRKHLGKLIGTIAASHHWDIEILETKLGTQQNALSGFPREWRIDPVKIACLLRCADASHIDNERAPDFLHALLKRHGISFNHWQAQNRLAAVDIDQSNPEKNTLLFTSTIDFKESEADSWFVAYDATCLVDKEIKACNLLLKNRPNAIPFEVQRVQGIESPEAMSKYIRADGWKPCSTEVHVGNIEKIIKNLGGEMLYGAGTDLFGVAIRELIQNARDSIHARKFVESDLDGYINIRLENIDEKIFITIEDNGIGMSERVLTGALLDFGTSFWTSSLVQSEFPGLRSSTFKSVGRFGIGFYSIFMIAENVTISTKRWDEGLTDLKHLKFTNGFSLRPILSKGALQEFSSSVSTKVKFELKDSIIPKNLIIEIKRNAMDSTNLHVHLKDYLSALSAGLDVSVNYIENCSNLEKIHIDIEDDNFDKEEWLKKISFSTYQPEDDIDGYISSTLNRIKPIIENNKVLGMAAISTQFRGRQNFLSILTVGGLAHTVHARDSNKFIGFIDNNPKSAKREIDNYSASKEVITDWAENQLIELLKINLPPAETYTAAAALCDFKVDPTPLAQILVMTNNQGHFLNFEDLAELSTQIGVAFLQSGLGIEEHMEMHHQINSLDGYALVRPLDNSSFLSLKMENDIPCNNNSILDCLYRAILKKGKKPEFTTLENAGNNQFGQNISALVVSSK